MQDALNDCNEEWRAVVGFEGLYEISDRGRVKRVKGGKGATIGAILRPHRLPNGYYRVILYPKRSGRSGYLHHLVSEAFLGPCLAGLERNHRDGDKANNTPGNLEYVTHAENLRHAKHHGLLLTGSRRPDAKLNECLVRLIKVTLRYESSTRTAKLFQLPPSTVNNIARGTCWANVALIDASSARSSGQSAKTSVIC